MEEEIRLVGGNMGSAVKRSECIYKNLTPASENLHALLQHVRSQGLDWVSESIELDLENSRHVLGYIAGFVPHDPESWLFSRSLIVEVGTRLRDWHDATVGFVPKNDFWNLPASEPQEVVCHNDFAPYNCVFSADRKLIGLIDFDTCSPGSRLWDISYAAYRFVPLLPNSHEKDYVEYSTFTTPEMVDRLELFLSSYCQPCSQEKYTVAAVVATLQARLIALSEFSARLGRESKNAELLDHSAMYKMHSTWLKNWTITA